jgi:DNA replication and repair protein RecF
VIVTSLSLTDFRNFERLEFEPDPVLTILVGPNAVGKTNAVEALQVATAGHSFRRPHWGELVRWGAESARVRVGARGGVRALEIAVEILPDGTHSTRTNGQARRRGADAVGLVPSVTFTPDDLEMVKGPAERRRAAIDDLGEQMSATYGSLRRDYGRAVRQRNALLKEGAPTRETEVWDEQVAALGARLLTHRLRLLARVMERASADYAEMAAGEHLDWRYEDKCSLAGDGKSAPDVPQAEAAIRREFERRGAEERRRGVTLAGPHRDDIVLMVEGRDARAFASQGQQRTIALAWKLAEVSVIEDVAHRRPLLLLDDVMSELDARRRVALSETVAGPTQTFITTTNLGYFDKATLSRAKIVELKGLAGRRVRAARRRP